MNTPVSNNTVSNNTVSSSSDAASAFLAGNLTTKNALHQAFFEIAELSSRDLELDVLYESIHRVVCRLTDADNFLIALLNEKEGYATCPYCKEPDVNGDPEERVGFETLRSSTVVSRVFESQNVVHLLREDRQEYEEGCQADATWDSTEFKPYDVANVPHEWLGVPLVCGDKLIGALVVQTFDQQFHYTADDKKLLLYVGQHIAGAVERKGDRIALLKADSQLQDRNAELVLLNERLSKVDAERAAIQATARHNASHDVLTGLPNRSLFVQTLRETLVKASSDSSEFAVLFLDIDRFKFVNNSFGHLAGDQLLQQIAKRLAECVRGHGTVSRFGGDGFCVLLPELDSHHALQEIGDRILKRVNQAVQINGQPMLISTGIGAAIGPAKYINTDEILRDANTALDAAKTTGRGCFRVFDDQLRKVAIDRLRIEQELRLAIDRNELTVFYQPIVKTETSRIVAVEALVRWEHAVLGWISPAEFIPMAEESGLIVPVSNFVMSECARQLKEWQTTIPGCEKLVGNLNVSAAMVTAAQLCRPIVQLLRKNDLDPSTLKLEITETAFLSNYKAATEVLHQISELGVGLALDDFGTGYSSLTYIHDLPLDEIKIDLSFIRTVHTNARSKAIVQTILALASILDLVVTAEGVETVEQRDLLAELGAQQQQGYLFSRPCNADEMTKKLLEESGEKVKLRTDYVI